MLPLLPYPIKKPVFPQFNSPGSVYLRFRINPEPRPFRNNMAIATIEEYIASQPGQQPAILEHLRYLIRNTHPAIKESLKWGKPNYELGKTGCYLAAQKNTVNLGFFDASLLPDPEKILEGTGAKMRHVKIRNLESLPEIALQNLLRHAFTSSATN